MNRKKFLITALLFFIICFTAACGKKDNNTGSNGTGSSTVTATSTPVPTQEPVKEVTPDPVTPSAAPVEPTELPSTSPDVTVIPDDTDAPTPTPIAANPTDIPPTPTPSVRDTTAERDEYWNLTYLIWLPEFTAGSFDSKSSDDTFDYATFSDVSSSDVDNYKEHLKENGFTNILRDESLDDTYLYMAGNADDWLVRLTYTDGQLTIGSGFEDSEEPDSDEAARNLIWSSTILEYVPLFESGIYTGFETEEDDTIFCYAFFNNVTENEVRNYIAGLKEAGYIYGIDEGDSDGIIWFMAINEDRLNCYVAYDNSIVKIGCGYEE